MQSDYDQNLHPQNSLLAQQNACRIEAAATAAPHIAPLPRTLNLCTVAAAAVAAAIAAAIAAAAIAAAIAAAAAAAAAANSIAATTPSLHVRGG